MNIKQRKDIFIDKEEKNNVDRIKQYKTSSEATMILSIYKNPELLLEYPLQKKDFLTEMWSAYWEIAHGIIMNEKKYVLDDISIGLYLDKHPKLQKLYDKYGGYDTVNNFHKYLEKANTDSYITDFYKWRAIYEMYQNGFPVMSRLDEFVDKPLEQIYVEYEAMLNHIFINIGNDVKSYDFTEGIHELIEELDMGISVGLPYFNMRSLNKETGGQATGNITLVGALSNVGKSTAMRSMLIPSHIENEERLVICVNEEGIQKWQREMVVWVANNIYKKDLQKYIVRDGKYSPEVKELLHKCASWLEEKTENNLITVIPFTRYTTANFIKVLKKYANLGVKYFILDTFKADAGSRSDKAWMDMQQNMVDIYDTVKSKNEGGLDLHVAITFQLGKSSARQRFYSIDNIGLAKNIVDPASTCFMIRNVFEDEYSEGRNELKVYRLEGKNAQTKIPVKLEHGKKYQLLFIVKNREGASNTLQIVCEHDMSRNILKEVGFTSVPVDF